jgi:hypothetical protein
MSVGPPGHASCRATLAGWATLVHLHGIAAQDAAVSAMGMLLTDSRPRSWSSAAGWAVAAVVVGMPARGGLNNDASVGSFLPIARRYPALTLATKGPSFGSVKSDRQGCWWSNRVPCPIQRGDAMVRCMLDAVQVALRIFTPCFKPTILVAFLSIEEGLGIWRSALLRAWGRSSHNRVIQSVQKRVYGPTRFWSHMCLVSKLRKLSRCQMVCREET